MDFNFNRFLLQLKCDVLQNYRFLYIMYMVLFGIMMMLTAFNSNAGSGVFWFALFGGGLVFTSTLFDEMNNPQPKQFYLTTPSSHLEKFTSKLLISTIGYTIVTMVVFMVISFVTTLIIEMRTGNDLENFNPFYSENIESIKSYLIIQSIFLLGAITFRRFAFLKTIAVILGIVFVFSTIWMTFGLGAMVQHLPIGNGIDFDISDVNVKDNIGNTLEGYYGIINWMYLLLLAPAMWIISYFKLTEKEV